MLLVLPVTEYIYSFTRNLFETRPAGDPLHELCPLTFAPAQFWAIEGHLNCINRHSANHTRDQSAYLYIQMWSLGISCSGLMSFFFSCTSSPITHWCRSWERVLTSVHFLLWLGDLHPSCITSDWMDGWMLEVRETMNSHAFQNQLVLVEAGWGVM